MIELFLRDRTKVNVWAPMATCQS